MADIILNKPEAGTQAVFEAGRGQPDPRLSTSLTDQGNAGTFRQ